MYIWIVLVKNWALFFPYRRVGSIRSKWSKHFKIYYIKVFMISDYKSDIGFRFLSAPSFDRGKGRLTCRSDTIIMTEDFESGIVFCFSSFVRWGWGLMCNRSRKSKKCQIYSRSDVQNLYLLKCHVDLNSPTENVDCRL